MHGDLKGAASQFGQAIVGGATDVAMVFAPEAAPEIEAGEMAARGGAEAAEAAGSSTADTMDSVVQGANLIKKGNDWYNDINGASNYVTGNGNNGQGG